MCRINKYRLCLQIKLFFLRAKMSSVSVCVILSVVGVEGFMQWVSPAEQRI